LSFEIIGELQAMLDDYHVKSMKMEHHVIKKIPFEGNLEKEIDDDLIYNVPIYDMGSRRYAAFCSFTEAVWHKEKDCKGNGKYLENDIKHDYDWFILFYLFRLCGSGINYIPRIETLFDDRSFEGTHGFGNFWIIESILQGKHTAGEWFMDLQDLDKPFSNNKGYLLPQFSYPHLNSGHLKYFIIHDSWKLVAHIFEEVHRSIERLEIYQVTDIGNDWLNKHDYKKQNFVLTAFACDLAEYFPELVDPKSRLYAGTNATKCIKSIYPKVGRVKEFDYINDVLQYQAERYNLNPMDCEDSRNCDIIRYLKEYQSKDHISYNNGKVMLNNSVLKNILGQEKYYKFANKL
jgi:hypothetical protein